MSKRKTCSHCMYPETRCLCRFLTPVKHKTKITIIQCDKEGSNAKNTAKLLPFLSKNISIVTEQDIADSKLLSELSIQSDETAILFPSLVAKSISTCVSNNFCFDHLIVIDGTWKKAKKLFYTHPWLNDLSHVALSEAYISQYAIRKTSIDNGLSTLEAIAYAIEENEGVNNVDISPFFKLLDGINKTFIEHMPKDVKSRYQ